MSTIEQSIDVDVPVRTAYNQWTQFEEFPQFMEGVELPGLPADARVTEQIPDERVAWTSTEGAEHAGVVTFHRLDDDRTRVMLQMEVEPEGPAEKVGDLLGVLKRRVKGDLEKFKQLIESRGRESGAWRGDVRQTNA
jgi:uncharacterized membrane protein